MANLTFSIPVADHPDLKARIEKAIADKLTESGGAVTGYVGYWATDAQFVFQLRAKGVDVSGLVKLEAGQVTASIELPWTAKLVAGGQIQAQVTTAIGAACG